MDMYRLWENEVPLAQGNTDEDIPALTPYLVEGGSKGAVIVIPGGGYSCRAGHEGDPIAAWLQSIGISAFVLRYRVSPYKHPVPLYDVQRAIRYVRHNQQRFQLETSKIGLLGFSAGGHLAASAGTGYDAGNPEAADVIDRQSSRPDALVLCYPVISMAHGVGHDGSRYHLLGESASDEQILAHSCDKLVTDETPEAFLWHTSEDDVSVENSLLFASALRRHNIAFDLHVYARGRHGLGLAEEDPHVATWTALCATWLERQGF